MHKSVAAGPLLALAIVLIAAPTGRGESLTLAAAGTLAVAGSAGLQLTRLDVAAADARASVARAERLPTVSLQANGALMTSPQEAVILPQGGLVSPAIPATDVELFPAVGNTTLQLIVTMEQTVFAWSRITTSIAAAETQAARQRLALAEARSSVAVDVHRLYFSLQLARRSLELLDLMAAIGEERTEDTLGSFQEGLVTRRLRRPESGSN